MPLPDTVSFPEFPAWPPANAEPINVTTFYDDLATTGYEYGPTFQGLQAAWRDRDTVYAEITLTEDQTQEAARFTLHPAPLDAALHTCVLNAGETGQEVQLPFSWSQVQFHATGAAMLRVAVTSVSDG
ncbi:polyketide synthase dehydratase domain-containing protein [Streptomyces sp. NPDC093109]|uniref:polyketide synthase dehydratase domain-containing protein n=1 Tax=Streptomyces sp. NPDC093109 TaxID=3154977 RepID=UPI00344F5145